MDVSDDMLVIEALNDDGTFRSDIFYDTLNTSYIPIALRAARRADPHAKLYINDYKCVASFVHCALCVCR